MGRAEDHPAWAEPGKRVRVKRFRTVCTVLRYCNNVGGRALDKRIDGFRLWNVDELVPVNARRRTASKRT